MTGPIDAKSPGRDVHFHTYAPTAVAHENTKDSKDTKRGHEAAGVSGPVIGWFSLTGRGDDHQA